jgi:GMP synthase-like glutamine amidotransferase
MMRVLLFQHHDNEGPGTLGHYLQADGGSIDTVHFTHGDTIPNLNAYDQLWIMGGPMDVWDIEDCPWLIEEKRAIRAWVNEVKKPCLGLCLGHQLLADSLNGTCGPMRPPEIGVLPVNLTATAKSDPLFEGLPGTFPCVQWHGVRVAQLPDGAELLASSDVCAIQAARFAPGVYGFQGHVEVENDTVSNWGVIPAYAAALEKVKGPGALHSFEQAAAREMPAMQSLSLQLYKNLRKMSG